MKSLNKILIWLSSLKIAIFLLIIIALASALGTAIPQNEEIQYYITNYSENPWLGFINGEIILNLQLNHIYSSFWFLFLLFWLALALIICSWKRQWPKLKSALNWIDYKSIRQIKKLAISKTIQVNDCENSLTELEIHLQKEGWNIKKNPGRIAARKGVIGRVGPPLVHLGLILLILGATIGNLNGQKTEKFLAPGKSINLLSPNGEKQLSVKLLDFNINRGPTGQAEQFISKIELIEPNQSPTIADISVNHPYRSKGLTIYQADWSLAAITMKIQNSPLLQLPLSRLPQLGDNIWGLIIPTKDKNSDPILLTVANEKGPIKVFNEEGEFLTNLSTNKQPMEIKGINISIFSIISSSGLLLKHDPGVPIVYTGFAITLIGGFISVLSTRQLWAISDPIHSLLHIGGLSNRNLTGLANDLPRIIELISTN